MSTEDFRNVAAGIQSLFVVIAIAAGGVWALIRFRALNTVEKARAELEKTKQELHPRGVVNVEINLSQLNCPAGGGSFISVALKLTNVGTKAEVVDWIKSTVNAMQVGHKNGKLDALGELHGNLIRTASIASSTLMPGESIGQTYVICVKRDGIYLVDVRLAASPQAVLEHTLVASHVAEEHGGTLGEVSWGGVAYLTVSGTETSS